MVQRIAPWYIFGFDRVPYGDFDVPVSALEKTLTDLVHFGESPREGRPGDDGAEGRQGQGGEHLERHPETLADKYRSALR